MPLSRLRNVSIKTKLIGIVTVFVVAIVVIILMVTLAFRVNAGVRSYVVGEGLWSKGQKDAVYFLSRYIQTQDEHDDQAFARAIEVPQGYRRSRLEMLKSHYDRALVARGFVDGGITAADVPSMIFLLRNFHNAWFIARAVSKWEEGDAYTDRLDAIATEAREAAASATLDLPKQAALLQRIEEINAATSPIEAEFSRILGEASRFIQTLLLTSVLVVTLLLVLSGLLVSWLVGRDLAADIEILRTGAIRVAHGELDHLIAVRSSDELGELATVFNDMILRRRDAEAALTTATEFRERVMESSTNAIYTMDMEGRFTTANRRTCEVTGYPIEELIGLPWAVMVPPEHLPDLFVRYSDTVQGRAPILNYEVPLTQKGGNVVTITFSVAALSRDGVIFGVVGTAEDITERKRAEAELKARADALARSNQELEQFAYVASHDLQEPLRTVSGFAQLLANRYQSKLGPEADEYIGYVTSGAQRMKSLIEDLLAFSRVSRDPESFREVDLGQALRSALANVQGAIDATGATIRAGALPTVHANDRQMVQLLQNLIGNAVKFHGPLPPVVTISAEAQENEWLFTVRDNGIGIDERHAKQVFVLFQRLHGREKYQGNGIGLTICKKIVDLHGGRIWIEPGEGGAVFRFTLHRDTPPALPAA